MSIANSRRNQNRLLKIDPHFFIEWFRKRGRQFPWRLSGLDPFHQLITEMLLRKTRAESVAKLWPRLVARYPDANSIVRTSKKKLSMELKVLGFGNQKADALRSASEWLIKHHEGEVPKNFDDLMRIPHIGAYSAGAVLCFAYKKRIEIVDVNVQRFFARFYGIEVKTDVRRNAVVRQIAFDWLPRTGGAAGQHNYGLLDFTAEICKSARPRCEICPLATVCSWGKKTIGGGIMSGNWRKAITFNR